MCRTVGYRVSLPPDCKNNTTPRHGNPHPTVKLISNTTKVILVNPRLVSDSCFYLFRADMVEAGSFPLVDPLSAIILCFHLYSKVCMHLKRKWESPVSYNANKPALFIYKCKVALLSQLIGN